MKEDKMTYKIINKNCLDAFKHINEGIDLTFLDPPFNQQKKYTYHDDNMNEADYWQFMKEVCVNTFNLTNEGGAIYFMQREKNAEFVLRILRESGWTLQNVIIWKKKTSAVPVATKYGKQYQVIAYATKGKRAKTFHRLRIDPELPANYKHKRENGIYVTDVWDDIRELTSGFFAGEEAVRDADGARFHKQQSPIALLLRIILSSSNIGDTVFDPFAGTGTTSLVAHQVQRRSIAVEIDPKNAKYIEKRLSDIRDADLIGRYYKDYICTKDLSDIWGENLNEIFIKKRDSNLQTKLF